MSVLRGLAASLGTFVKDYICPKYAFEAMLRQEAQPWTVEMNGLAVGSLCYLDASPQA